MKINGFCTTDHKIAKHEEDFRLALLWLWSINTRYTKLDRFFTAKDEQL